VTLRALLPVLLALALPSCVALCPGGVCPAPDALPAPSLDRGAILRFRDGPDGSFTASAVPMADGRLLTVGADHEAVFLGPYGRLPEWLAGPRCERVVVPEVGQRVTLRTVHGETGGVVLANDGRFSDIRLDAPTVRTGHSGSGVWTDERSVCGVLDGCYFESDPTFIVVERP